MAEGFHYLDLSASGDELTEMHLEAGIAGTHCLADSYEHTDWDAIINLYDRLTRLKSSPILALNRAIALAERRGPRAGLEAIQSIPDQVWRATTCSGPPSARCIYGSASSAGPRRISNARSR